MRGRPEAGAEYGRAAVAVSSSVSAAGKRAMEGATPLELGLWSSVHLDKVYTHFFQKEHSLTLTLYNILNSFAAAGKRAEGASPF